MRGRHILLFGFETNLDSTLLKSLYLVTERIYRFSQFFCFETGSGLVAIALFWILDLLSLRQ